MTATGRPRGRPRKHPLPPAVTSLRQIIDEAHRAAIIQSGTSTPYLLEVIRALADELDRQAGSIPHDPVLANIRAHLEFAQRPIDRMAEGISDE